MRQIRGPNHPGFIVDEVEDFPVIPRMVAHRNAVYAPFEQLPGNRGVYSAPSGRIFPVGDNDVRIIFVFDPWKQPFDRVSSDITYDIPNKNDLHPLQLAFRTSKTTSPSLDGGIRLYRKLILSMRITKGKVAACCRSHFSAFPAFRNLFGVLNRAGFTNNGNLDVTWIVQFALDFLRNIPS